MLRRSVHALQDSGSSGPGPSIGARFWGGLGRLVTKYVPDPRHDPMKDRPVGYEDLRRVRKQTDGPKEGGGSFPGAAGMREDETLEEYMERRTKEWQDRMKLSKQHQKNIRDAGGHVHEDGSPFMATGIKAVDATAEANAELIRENKAMDIAVDEEKLKLRRQLQVENEAQFRKYVSELKRSELAEERTIRKRLAHPSDPNYDPFKQFPGYRPQDSAKLATWLRRQRESGQTVSGESLETQKGQERFYNEEKMATQYHANPFSDRVEVPKGKKHLEVEGFSPDSIIVNSKEIIGSTIVTPQGYYHWNVHDFEDITLEKLSLLLHIYPPPDILFLGTGRNLRFVSDEIKMAFQKRGTVLHCLTTRDAISNFSLQLTIRQRIAGAFVMCVPTNPFEKEAFGEFIENDIWTLSDSALGIFPMNQVDDHVHMMRGSSVAEKYRHMQGTGIGPKYRQLSSGIMVKPGTAGTKLRPMLEPGEEDTVEWEKLPSYYHWFPKESLEDYIENNDYHSYQKQGGVLGMMNKSPEDSRLNAIMRGDAITGTTEEKELDEPPKVIMPWENESLPVMTWPHERFPEEITVEDPKSGRIVGMDQELYKKWKKMMAKREELNDGEPLGKEYEDVEYDQERIVSDKQGKLFDVAKNRYQPLYEGKWSPRRKSAKGQGSNVNLPT